MPKKRSWTDEELAAAVKESNSYRTVIRKLGLIPAGGNYDHVKYMISKLKISTEHFTGKGWNRDLRYEIKGKVPIEKLLVQGSHTQSYKLKNKLFKAGLKHPRCELCGWAEVSNDGRIPVELDHINGNHHDNRIKNLRILCPNCHSLQPTHRGRNKKTRLVKMNIGAGAGTR